jgi:hypothetical protein
VSLSIKEGQIGEYLLHDKIHSIIQSSNSHRLISIFSLNFPCFLHLLQIFEKMRPILFGIFVCLLFLINSAIARLSHRHYHNHHRHNEKKTGKSMLAIGRGLRGCYRQTPEDQRKERRLANIH